MAKLIQQDLPTARIEVTMPDGQRLTVEGDLTTFSVDRYEHGSYWTFEITEEK
ncbi:hypothetical protein OV450_3376 [Actinobacteria bacterium OV450]|nr:hypothetical protein OV450_3376 [Actinobacteria bacterium OV450]